MHRMYVHYVTKYNNRQTCRQTLKEIGVLERINAKISKLTHLDFLDVHV